VPEPALDALAAVSAVKDFSAHSTIFREGAENHFLYILNRGHVGLDMHVAGRGRVRILSLGPGEMLAWSALLGDGRMTATATALEDTQVISTPGQHLLELCNVSHEFGYQLMTRVADVLAKRLVATRLQLLDLFSPSVSGDRSDGS
jgi:CRP-like cAMP-binding protein